VTTEVLSQCCRNRLSKFTSSFMHFEVFVVVEVHIVVLCVMMSRGPVNGYSGYHSY
jgi:hypothetical protein